VGGNEKEWEGVIYFFLNVGRCGKKREEVGESEKE